MASIRVRDVRARVESGSTLKSEFKYFRDLKNAPNDVNQEYLRILRRAYAADSSDIRPQVVKNYHDTVGTTIAARQPLSVYPIPQPLQINEDEVRVILRPINSIVDLPLNNTFIGGGAWHGGFR